MIFAGLNDLVFTCNAILPILLPVLVGYFLNKIHFFKEGWLAAANRVVFTIFIPILLFSNLYLADLSKIDWKLVGFSAGSIIVLFFIGLIVTLFFSDRKQKGVILQASFRSNYAIIGIPLATMLGGEAAGAAAAVVAAVSVPLFNILAVISLTMFDHEEGQKVSIKNILKKIATNPLIIGVCLGIIVCAINSAIGMQDVKEILRVAGPKEGKRSGLYFVSKTIKDLAGIATPLALVVLGGRFKFSAVKRLWCQLVVSVTLRLVLTPVIFLTIAYFIKLKTSTDFAILIALFGTPIAVSSAPMAAQMGQDEELAGQIVVWTTAISAISLFLVIFICSAIGIF